MDLKKIKEYWTKLLDSYKAIVGIAGFITAILIPLLFKIYNNENYLYYSIIASLLVLWIIFFFFISQKRTSPIQSLSNSPVTTYKFRNRRTYLFFVSIACVSGLICLIYQFYKISKTDRNKIIVLIVPFKNEADTSKDIFTTQLCSELNDELDTNKSIKIELLDKPISEKDGGIAAAIIVAKERRASILIWGWYTKSPTNIYLKTKFEMLDSTLMNIRDKLNANNKKGSYKISQLNNFELQTEFTNSNSFLIFCSIGYIKSVQLKWIESIDYFKKALKFKSTDQNNSKVNFFTGYAYWRLKEPDQAIFYLKESLKSDTSSSSYNVLGIIYSESNQFDLAMKYYNQALKIDPLNYEVYNNIGVLEAKTKKYNLALENFTHAFTIGMSDTTILKNLSNMYQLRKALDDDITKNKDNPPRLYTALTHRLTYYYNSENYKEALNDVNWAIKLYPDSSKLYLMRGNIEDDGENKKESALKDYSHALKLAPDNAQVYYERGVIYKRLGLIRQALKDYDKSISIKPFAETYNNRGGIYMTLKMYEKAYQEFNNAFKISSPKDSSFYASNMRKAEHFIKTNN